MGSLFESCSSLETVNLKNFSTKKVRYMYNMFGYSTNLKVLMFLNLIQVKS